MSRHSQDGGRNGGTYGVVSFCMQKVGCARGVMEITKSLFHDLGTHWGVSSSTCDLRHGKGSESSSEDPRNNSPT
jgi:hypothetical protein